MTDKKAPVAITENNDIKRAVHKALKLIGGLEEFTPLKLNGEPTFLIKPNACVAADPDSGVVTTFRWLRRSLKRSRQSAERRFLEKAP